MTESERYKALDLIIICHERLETLDNMILNDDKYNRKDIILEWKCLNTYIAVLGDKIKNLKGKK